MNNTLANYGFKSRFWGAHTSKFDLPEDLATQVLNWNAKSFKDKKMFTLVGNPGLGKTYLCAALANDWIERGEKWIRYYRESDFIAAIRDVWPDGWDSYKEIERICEADYFILDDMFAVYADNSSQDISKNRVEMIIDAVNIRYENEKPTVLTSNLTEKEIKEKVAPSFLSRLKASDNVFIERIWKDKREIIYET